MRPWPVEALAESDLAELEELLAGVYPDEAIVGRLARYGSLVLEANRRVNITGAKTAADVAAHIADSLSVLPYVHPPYVDVGSGAGFPAIPIAIVSGIDVTMIESTGKKAHVLEALLAGLALPGRVVAERAEIAGHQAELREQFVSGTCRAVAGGSVTAELLLPLVRIGGTAVLQRGRLDEGERASLEDAALVLGGRLDEILPAGGERRIVLLKKDRGTPLRFPRRTGTAKKRPLCS
ncbi:MAG TPA: RsmG family class I SAM-dependent methyltransferase [Candidatus Cybelea sp.]|nr:RsmG family class I SAM-dependent methyltransferase [Candidatus Cybelea sp.]